MVDIAKENLCINKLVAEKKDILMLEGDMIVPDAKPDILNTICTSGVACIYKKELQEEKVRLDGSIQTYIMYLPEGTEEGVRGLCTTLDFSESIDVPRVGTEGQLLVNAKVKSIEAKVINGRKIGIKVALEVELKVYQKEEIEIVNEIQGADNIQILKQDLKVNSLVGTGTTKIIAKDTLQIDAIDQLAEILKVGTAIIDKDTKMSYNKVLTKAEVEIKMMYLTEDNRIGQVTGKIPVVGFIDLPNVSENQICDMNYEVKNVVIKPNAQEEHSVSVEMELEVICNVYEEKQLNLIQDVYSPCQKLNFDQKQVMTMSDKQNRKQTKQIREKVNVKEMENKNLVGVDVLANFVKETKINSKILYEGELQLKFMFMSSHMQITTQEAQIPFEYVIDQIQNGESFYTNNDIEITAQDFVVQDGGDITCNIDLGIDTSLYRTANINVIDQIEEEGEREEQDYSIMMYMVKKGDSLWEIAKKLGSTVEDIVRTNGIENEKLITPGQKLFIPRYVKMSANHYA